MDETNMDPREEASEFYRSHVPAQFNRTLASQREDALTSPVAARVLAEMEAVRASIVVELIGGEAAQASFVYDIDRGQMKLVDAPTHLPFLVLAHSLADFENLRRECGDSLLGFLGGLAGLGDEMRLTSQRVRSLRELSGSVVFERIGDGGFALEASFGVAERTTEPRATIRLDEATYARLRRGELDPQDAFLAGEIEVLGDEAMAIELALTALSPD